MSNKFQTTPVVGGELASQAKLIIKAFGLAALKPKFYSITNTDQLQTEKNTRIEGIKNADKGFFGLPVFDVLTFADKDYQTLDKETISIKEFSMGVALIEVNQSKNIVTTPIQGRNGTVKEYISDGDYMITIRGVISTVNQDTYPEDEVASLIKFLQVPESIEVGSNVLSRFGISDIVITSYNFPQEEAMRNIQRFEIQALSETPFEIKSSKENNHSANNQQRSFF